MGKHFANVPFYFKYELTGDLYENLGKALERQPHAEGHRD